MDDLLTETEDVVTEGINGLAKAGDETPDGGRIDDPNGAETKTQVDLLQALQDPDQEVMFAIAGRRAVDAQLGALEAAKRMESQKKTPARIWAETGWFRGPDNEWRFEIDDGPAKINENLNSLIGKQADTAARHPGASGRGILSRLFGRRGGEAAVVARESNGSTRLINLPLTDLFSHPKLYSAYPFLRQMHVNLNWVPGLADDRASGSIVSSRRKGRIKYYPINVTAGSPNGIKHVLLHEIQHYIQNREGFAQGSSVVDQDNAIAEGAQRDLMDRILDRGKQRIYDPHQGRFGKDDFRWMVRDNLLRSDSEAESISMRLLDLYEQDRMAERGDSGAQFRREDIERLEGQLEKSMRATAETYGSSYGEFEAEEVWRRAQMTPEERVRTFPLANLPAGMQPSTWQTGSYQEAYDEIMRRAMTIRTIGENWAKRADLGDGVSVVRNREDGLEYVLGSDPDGIRVSVDLYQSVGGAAVKPDEAFYHLPYGEARSKMDMIGRDIRNRNVRPTLDEWGSRAALDFWRRYDPAQVASDPRLYAAEIQKIADREHGGRPVFFADEAEAMGVYDLEADQAYVMQPGRALTEEELTRAASLEEQAENLKREGKVTPVGPGAAALDYHFSKYLRTAHRLEFEAREIRAQAEPEVIAVDLSSIIPHENSRKEFGNVDQDMLYQARAQERLDRFGIEGDRLLSLRGFYSPAIPSVRYAAGAAGVRADIDKAVSKMLPPSWRHEVSDTLIYGRGSVEGYADPYERIIYVSLAATDPLERTFEECGHALRAARLISAADYDILRAEGQRLGAREHFEIDARYGETYGRRWQGAALEDRLDEEAIMQMIAAHARGKTFGEPSFAARRILDRIVNFLRDVGEMLCGRGFRTYEDVFDDMISGRAARPGPLPDIAADGRVRTTQEALSAAGDRSAAKVVGTPAHGADNQLRRAGVPVAGDQMRAGSAPEIREMMEGLNWADSLYDKQIKFSSASLVAGHVNALAETGTDEDAFHLVFTLLRDDVAADAKVVVGIASAYAGKDLLAGDRESGLGAIEEHFYDQRKAQAQASSQEIGGRRSR